MSAGRHLFRKTEIARACKAVAEIGLGVNKVRITPEGEIKIETGPPTAPAGNANDEWTDWTPTDGKTAA
jgi:hypothetical protein